MQITIKIQDNYANGDEFTRIQEVTVDPLDGADPDDWASDTLFEFTGQGEQYANIESFHEVKVLQCTDRPELVGMVVEFG